MKDFLKILFILIILYKSTYTLFGSSEEDFQEDMDESAGNHICKLFHTIEDWNYFK